MKAARVLMLAASAVLLAGANECSADRNRSHEDKPATVVEVTGRGKAHIIVRYDDGLFTDADYDLPYKHESAKEYARVEVVAESTDRIGCSIKVNGRTRVTDRGEVAHCTWSAGE